MQCDCQLTQPERSPHHRGHCNKEAVWILQGWNRALCNECRQGYEEWSQANMLPWGDGAFIAIVVPKPKQPDPFSLPPEKWPEDVRELWTSVQDDLGLLPGETVDEVRYVESQDPTALRMKCQFVYRVIKVGQPNAGWWRVLEFDGASDYSYTWEWINTQLDRKP